MVIFAEPAGGGCAATASPADNSTTANPLKTRIVFLPDESTGVWKNNRLRE